ncbi:uncharacterized protein LOC100831536 isoform X2 [Brachypodium distachyon]|uniref:J domain-containing protein n=1 Tax=Brachypodium distachyon TaxID=15368 RepID=I1HPR3_BRADI|nr:uncharacterized protein LOC100831536 isoform X2 [Brachypodium distachyon]KQK08881.1 hypothetical protein BRADI_2g44490v3 [Brachypodium distachyon]|eukprot:XP_010232064.1 uncharacterized protein LOC100831536 isoform X2 [Brachypodium distachyon]
MEELAARAPPPPPRHRARRHRRKASDSSAYGDVFGGPPRFAAPFAGVPGDYADVFGGVAASCSIPYLDLPPAAACRDGGGAGAYGEIFARFDFGEFAAPYEDVFAEAEGMAEEIASWSGSSRSSIRKESGDLDAEPSLLYQHYPNIGYDQHFDEEQFSPMSFPPDGEQQFSMSYNMASRGRLDDLVEMTTCMVEPSINYVIDSCNLPNDSAADHVPVVDHGTVANGEKKETSPPPVPAISNSVADQKQHISTCLPITENLYEDENDDKKSSSHSASSDEVPSPDYPFLRVSNSSTQTAPIKVQPPSMLPPNLLNKNVDKANGDSEVNPNSAAAAAAIKEAMQFAEARLKAAKELMERKGDSFKLRKRPGHHRSTKSTEITDNKTPQEVHIFEEKQTLRMLAKDEKKHEDLAKASLDKHTDNGTVKLADCCHDAKGVVPLVKPQQMMQSGSKCEGNNGPITNPFTNHDCYEKGNKGVTAGDLERYGKSLDGNDIKELKMQRVNFTEDATSMGVGPKAPEVSLAEERKVYQEQTDSHSKEYVGVSNSPEDHNDGRIFESSCINRTSPNLHVVPEISSLPLEACISGGHTNGNKKCSDASTEETPLVVKSNEDNCNKDRPEVPCADETLCSFTRSQISHEHPEVPDIDEIKINQAESYETQCSQKMSSRVHRDAEAYEKDRMFRFVNEACLQNEKEIITEIYLDTPIGEETENFGAEDKADPHGDCLEEDVYWDAGSPEQEINDTVSSNDEENDEAEALDVFLEDSKLMESNVRTGGTFAEESDKLPESQGSLLEPQDLANKVDGVEDLGSHSNIKEAETNVLENSKKTLVDEILNHDKEGQISMETDTNKGLNDVYAEILARNNREGNVLHSETEVVAKIYSDYSMKMSTCSKDLQASFSEACASMQHLSQNAESVSARMSDEGTPFLENLENDCPKVDTEILANRYTALEGENTESKTEERDCKDRISSVNLKDRQSFAEDSASNFVQKSRGETPDVQKIDGSCSIRNTEREIQKEVSLRSDKAKGRECKMEREETKERTIREQEEEKERERERTKDRLAVQRATREAHERAFADARSKAERIALERITSSRQRASAKAHEKEEKASSEATTVKASREARIKAERAAVERATAEARDRAIEKAKAAADAKERMEKFRSSFKDGCKATNQDTQFQKAASNNYGRSTDSCDQDEFESALRHKARSERHQRTAERAEKALAEKNMRDMLVQREQAEKHRLAEFLDPEVKRWSNGKEGNLRALLSTLQYILGSDSGWQPVPLTDLITAAGVKKAYRKATLCVHPDKLQQRGATIRQKYICEKVFDLLKEAWNKFNSAER